jgi:GT2 family glycosyltransferase
MDVTLVIPVLNRYDLLKKTLETYIRGMMVPNRILIINNGNQGLPFSSTSYNIWEIKPPKNLGVAGSCNLAMKMCKAWGSYWLHSNDDVEVGRTMVHGLVTEMYRVLNTEDLPFVVPSHGEGSLFTIFLADPYWLMKQIGPFDEGFSPVYFEDNDYARRMFLTGRKYRNVVGDNGSNGYIHHTSSTRQRQMENGETNIHAQFSKCQAYYVKKWGGLPEQETFNIPFDGKGEQC